MQLRMPRLGGSAAVLWSVVTATMPVQPDVAVAMPPDRVELSAQREFPQKSEHGLVLALHDGDIAAAEGAIRAGADVNAIGSQGLSPLLWILETETSRRRMERAIRFLVEHGANPNYVRGSDSSCPMYFAVLQDSTDMLNLFLAHGGNPNLICAGGPLLRASIPSRRIETLELLVSNGADVNLTERPGASTAAEYAAAVGFFEATAWLLDHGYSNDLDRLARYVDASHVRPGSVSDQWKSRVREILRAKGVEVGTGD
jgi:ankyrin repeat protein